MDTKHEYSPKKLQRQNKRTLSSLLDSGFLARSKDRAHHPRYGTFGEERLLFMEDHQRALDIYQVEKETVQNMFRDRGHTNEAYLPTISEKRSPLYQTSSYIISHSYPYLSRGIHSFVSSVMSQRLLEYKSNQTANLGHKLHKSVTSSKPSNVTITMTYLGQGLSTQSKDEMKVFQQICGGENLCVFKGYLRPGEQFQFVSKRHHGYPFSATLFINGIMATRISSCCEYRYTIGLQQGRHSCFRLANLNGGQPCYRCVGMQNMNSRKNKLRVEEDRLFYNASEKRLEKDEKESCSSSPLFIPIRSSIRQDRPPLMQHRRLPHKVINASTDSEGLQTSVKTVNSLRPKRGSPPQTGDLLSSEETIDTVGEDERASRKVGTLGSLMRPSQPCEAMREVNSSVPSMAKPKAYQKKTRHLRSRNKKDSENRIKMKEAENEGETPPKDPLLDRTSPEKKDEKITGPNVHSRTGNTNGEQDAAEIRASKERVGIVSLPDKVQYKQHSLSKDREQRRRLVEKLSSVFQRSNSCTSDVELSDSSDTSEHTASTLSLRGTKGLRKNLACQPVNGDEEILSSKCRQDYSTKIYSKDGSIEGTTSKQGDNRSAPTCSGVSVHLGTDGSEELSDNPNQLKRNPQALLGNGDIKAESGHSHADQDQASLITEPPQRVCETASNQVCLGQPPVKHNLHLQHKQLGQGEDNSRHTSPQNTVDNIAEEPEPESSSPLNTDDEEVIKLLVSREVQEKAQYLRRQVADMVAVLEACDLVEQLVLRNTGLNDELLGCLVTALMNSPSEVKMINLNLNSIGPQGAQCLLDLLKIKPQVRGLLLFGNNLGDTGIVKLLSGLAELQTPQDREQMTTRSQEAEDRQNLTLLELDIGGNQMTSEGLGVVASFLRQCPLLQYLGLAKSNVADTAGWADLFDSLKTKTSIGHIILDENYLGDEGAKLFAEMLKLNASLCKVDLDSNGIGDDGGNAIFEALLSRTGGPLEHLSLEGNFISDNLLTRIHEQLKPNPT